MLKSVKVMSHLVGYLVGFSDWNLKKFYQKKSSRAPQSLKKMQAFLHFVKNLRRSFDYPFVYVSMFRPLI